MRHYGHVAPIPQSPRHRLRLLLDSNIFIAVEPYAGAMEASTAAAAQLVRLANEQGHLLCVHGRHGMTCCKGAIMAAGFKDLPSSKSSINWLRLRSQTLPARSHDIHAVIREGLPG